MRPQIQFQSSFASLLMLWTKVRIGYVYLVRLIVGREVHPTRPQKVDGCLRDFQIWLRGSSRTTITRTQLRSHRSNLLRIRDAVPRGIIRLYLIAKAWVPLC